MPSRPIAPTRKGRFDAIVAAVRAFQKEYTDWLDSRPSDYGHTDENAQRMDAVQ